MTRLRTVGFTLLVAALCAADLDAQRRGRGRGRGRPPQAGAPQPAEAPAEKKKVESWLAITGADVYLGNGSMLRRATVLCGDDKIHAVGHDVDIPDGAKVVDATGKFVSPGFCIVKASGMGAPRGSIDVLADGVNPFDPSIKLGLAAGITSFCALFDPGTSTPGGKSAVVKLAYGDLKGMVLKENSVVAMRVPLDPADMKKLRGLVRQAREYKKKLAEAQTAPAGASGSGGPAEAALGRGSGETGGRGTRGGGRSGRGGGGGGSGRPQPPPGTETILRIMDGECRLWIGSGGGGGGRGGRGGGGGDGGRGGFDNEAIRQALQIAEMLGVGIVLDSPTTAWTMPDEIAATDSMAILSPRTRERTDPGRPDDSGSNIAAAAILGEAGVPVAVTTPGGRFGSSPGIGTGGILGQDLNTPHIDAAFAVRGGMDNKKALRTITLDSARIIGADDRIGSIEVGKDADLLILDGDPLHYKTFVEMTIVNGKVVYEKDKEPFYSHIKR